ncbi:adenylate kinase isoenzyme 1-like [Drosophila albomicans]|uniref:Adenylate kinase isoenzyme 1-like n=1 Tax=Drosophila albomicans TaxID=7291 RepID=A0A9C6SZN0_DROAB|nr:adenylate kinase isoenzyme 1-like [Drosophila albomicans]
MGGPSSGKSTMSQNIVDKYGYKLLSPSELVEREIRSNSVKGVEFAAKRQEGHEVPLAECVHLLESEIMSNRGSLRGFVIDGYPQNQSDAAILEQSIGVPDLIIALEIGQQTAETRRSVDSTTLPSTVSFYMRNAQPVLAQYSDKIMQIDAERNSSDIFNDVVPNIDAIAKNYGNPIAISRSSH